MDEPIIRFWSYYEGDDSLLHLVLAGRKRALVSRLYNQRPGSFDPHQAQLGQILLAQDSQGRPRARLQVTDRYELTFATIPEKLWRAEACRDAEHLRVILRHSWPDDFLSPDFPLLAMHFELVEVLPLANANAGH
ncbi:ASCH domain-containing protein [Balneatrix alpica]|uniref:ASCH domain-containing protein n=1 Tax=Balneatrix alpica TaxID=75684 RepID=A0ABV5Z8C4_9GAMM|nr:ASCH domain-containing protein [Balneatrix alpica]